MAEVLVSALVCTRDRPNELLRAVRSLLASEGVELDLIIVDQSDGSETERLLGTLGPNPHLRYVRGRTRGLGAGLDEGLRLARSSLVIHTDDDCVVAPDWVAGMARALNDRPAVALVFCNVLAAPHDPDLGYVPAYERHATRVIRSPLATCRGRGLGAGMGFRRDAILSIGGVDVMMGAGSKFCSGEDLDIELRLLFKGWRVLQTADFTVVHHGFRTFEEGRGHAIRDWIGLGACLGKLIRAGHPSVLLIAAWELGAHAALPLLMDLCHLRRPRGIQRIVSFFRGFARGLAAPVERSTMCFEVP